MRREIEDIIDPVLTEEGVSPSVIKELTDKLNKIVEETFKEGYNKGFSDAGNLPF